jgi:hypothetical protein
MCAWGDPIVVTAKVILTCFNRVSKCVPKMVGFFIKKLFFISFKIIRIFSFKNSNLVNM